MLNITDELKKVMKKEMFPQETAAAKTILGELKTKLFDLKEVTVEIQFKTLKKMLDQRLTDEKTFINAGRSELAQKEHTEAAVINYYVSSLENELPKQMSEEEILKTLTELKNSTPNFNIGTAMKYFKDKPADKALVAKLIKSLL